MAPTGSAGWPCACRCTSGAPADGAPLVRGDVVATGPLTEVARALRSGQGLTRVVWMGGSVACARGVDPIGSEFNAAADRRAVDEVLGSGVPVRVIPIEVTVQVPFDDDDIAPWRAGPPIARLCADLVERRRGGSAGRVLLHDPVAIVAAVGARPVRLGGPRAPLPPRRLARGGSSRNRSGLGRRGRGPRRGCEAGS